MSVTNKDRAAGLADSLMIEFIAEGGLTAIQIADKIRVTQMTRGLPMSNRRELIMQAQRTIDATAEIEKRNRERPRSIKDIAKDHLQSVMGYHDETMKEVKVIAVDGPNVALSLNGEYFIVDTDEMDVEFVEVTAMRQVK